MNSRSKTLIHGFLPDALFLITTNLKPLQGAHPESDQLASILWWRPTSGHSRRTTNWHGEIEGQGRNFFGAFMQPVQVQESNIMDSNPRTHHDTAARPINSPTQFLRLVPDQQVLANQPED
jgi:hypothetical protein